MGLLKGIFGGILGVVSLEMLARRPGSPTASAAHRRRPRGRRAAESAPGEGLGFRV